VSQAQQSSPRGVSAPSPLAELSYDGSPLRRQAFQSYLTKSGVMSSSPTSAGLAPEVPAVGVPAAAALRRSAWPGVDGSPVNEVLASLRQLRLGGGSPRSAPSGGSFLAGGYPFGSPKSPTGLYSLPSTPPTRSCPVMVTTASGATIMTVECLNLGLLVDEEPVESGRALREKVFERLSKESVVPNDTVASANVEGATPNVGWVSDLIN
jgi:hypothetical protein